jgi:chromosome segregation ATPase
MSADDFTTLRQQFIDQWEGIEQAAPAERRVLAAELARLLLDWEVRQDAPLDKQPALMRAAHWAHIGELATAQAARLTAELDAKKASLRARLDEIRDRIETGQAETAALRDEVKSLADQLAIDEQALPELEQTQAALRDQLAALDTIRTLRAEIEQARARVGALADRLDTGDDPSGIIAELAALAPKLRDYYDAHIRADAEIAGRLADGATEAEDAREILSIPERLAGLDRELGVIDRQLANQLQRQDAADARISSPA